MRRVIFSVILILLTVSIGCQTKYESPQTIAWDDPVTTLGTITYEVYAIYKNADKTVQANYIFVGETADFIQFVDLQTLTLQGDHVIAVRTKQVYEGETFYSDYAYSDVDADVDPVGGTFYVRFIRRGKPEKVRVQ